MAQVFATYPGVDNVIACRYTRSLGVLPSVASLRIVPQLNLPANNGTLTIGHGPDQVSFSQCRVDQASLSITTKGHVVNVRIFDRRVWWQYAFVDGVYNLRDASNTIRSETRKSARALASILLDAMGESGYDVSALPANSYPFYHWECQSARSALAVLCDKYGCDVELRWRTDRVRIVQLGQGAKFPNNDDVQSVSFGVDLSEAPGSIEVCGNYSLFQSKLKLAPLALETDNSLKRLNDSTLSYAPTPGEDDGGFSEVVTNPADPLPEAESDVRLRARKSLYRFWEVESQADGSMNPPGWQGDEIEKVEQLLPVKHTVISSYENEDGVGTSKDAFLSGRFAIGEDPDPLTNTEPCEILEGTPFQLDTERGFVKTFGPVVKFNDPENADYAYFPADLYLTTSYNVQRPNTFQYHRFSSRRNLSQNPGTYAEDDVDIQETFVAEYSESGECTDVESVTDNTDEAQSLADERLDQIASQFAQVNSVQVIYRGIQRLDMDGARQQVKWVVSTSHEAMTIGVYNNETQVGALRRRERLRLLIANDTVSRERASQIRLRTLRRKGQAM